jgi:chemotaxis protein MotB
MALGEASITIKKVKKVQGHGHHGGAWKVAYADFVTAMMAFFLLMWLINTTTIEQKEGLANYFAPASVSATTSGAGGILAGTALGDDGSQGSGSMSIIEKLAPESPNPTIDGTTDEASLAAATEEELREALAQREEAALQNAAQSLRQAMQDMPELAELSKQIHVDITPEGLLIQLVDQEGRSMFETGSATPLPRVEIMLRAVSQTVNRLPNQISVSGHTNVSSSGRTLESDWDLSGDRANIARRIMQGSGVNPDRFDGVVGRANSDPLYPDDPQLAGNRRISILLLRNEPVLPPNLSL